MDSEISRCFGKYGDVEVDDSNVSPVEALGKVSAMAMPTTERVGHPEADPTMTQARPRLSLINDKGDLTDDSQMGKKIYKQFRDGSHGDHWQR